MLSLRNIPNNLDVDNSILLDTLDKRLKGIYTQKQFISVVLSWSYHHAFKLDCFMPLDVIEKPPHLIRYDRLPPEEKKLLNPEFKERIKTDKIAWLDKNAMIEHENESNYMWLEKMKYYYKYRQDHNKAYEIDCRMSLFNINKQIRGGNRND